MVKTLSFKSKWITELRVIVVIIMVITILIITNLFNAYYMPGTILCAF